MNKIKTTRLQLRKLILEEVLNKFLLTESGVTLGELGSRFVDNTL